MNKEHEILRAALDRIRVSAEQANAAFKPLAQLPSSLAAAAPADGPAVPEGREPAAVDGEPSDEEWDALVERVWDAHQTIGHQGERLMFDRDFDSAAAMLRDAFSRWGRPPAPPAPAAGEAGELARWLQSQASHHEAAGTQWARHLARAATLLEQLSAAPAAGEVGELATWLYRLADERTCNRRRGIRPHPSALTRAATLLERLSAQAQPQLQAPDAGEVGELVELMRYEAGCYTRTDSRAGMFTRAAALLERLSAAHAPVAVSERPWERTGWCDSNGRCWFGAPHGPADAVWILRRPSERLSYQTVSLPADALPHPTATTPAGQEGADA